MYIEGLVSCIIPTYKRSDTLEMAINSVLLQTYPKIEVLVVDDNERGCLESVAVKSLVDKIKDSRVRLILQEKHINGAEARNEGIRQSKGEYVAFLDDDDTWESEKIEKQIGFIRKFPSSCGAVSTLLRYYKQGCLVKKTLPYHGGYIFKEILRREYSVMTSSVLVKRSVLDDVGYFDNTLKRAQDLQLLTNLTYKYELYQLPEYLVNINVDDGRNRGDSRQTIEVKRAFFNSVEPVFNSLSNRERNQIYSLHQFERVPIEIKEMKYKQAFVDCMQVFRDVMTVWFVVRRVLRKWIETILAKI